MTVVAGGLRSRLILYNLFNMLNSSLTDLGWFNPGRRHKPISFVIEEQDLTSEVKINTLALSDEAISSTPWEIGSTLTEDTRWHYLDFFAENDAVGKDLIGDCRDILLGKLASVGRVSPTLDVFDLTQATPPRIFSCDIITVRVDRSHDYTYPWLRHWYSIQFSLFDYYSASG